MFLLWRGGEGSETEMKIFLVFLALELRLQVKSPDIQSGVGTQDSEEAKIESRLSSMIWSREKANPCIFRNIMATIFDPSCLFNLWS